MNVFMMQHTGENKTRKFLFKDCSLSTWEKLCLKLNWKSMVSFLDYTKVDEYPSMFPQYSNKIANNPNVAFLDLPGHHPVTVTEDVNGSIFIYL